MSLLACLFISLSFGAPVEMEFQQFYPKSSKKASHDDGQCTTVTDKSVKITKETCGPESLREQSKTFSGRINENNQQGADPNSSEFAKGQVQKFRDSEKIRR